jgi:hypothetical protein
MGVGRVGIAILTMYLGLASPASAFLVWGDVHAHSGLSNDATGEPEEFFRRARDVAGLDFVVLSDHDVFLTSDEWQRVDQTAAAFNEPGRFVTFAGIEWTHDWHMNLYFESDRLNICGDKPECDLGADVDFVRRIYRPLALTGAAAAHVNHPNALAPVAWEGLDDTFTSNVEIWNSLWNTNWFEDQPVLNDFVLGGPIWALQAGYRLGFVGVSDDHFVGEHISLLGSGLTACNVNFLSREEVLSALRNRRCYATNGARIEVSFDVDGTPMGAEMSAPLNSQVTVNLHVRGSETPRTIEVFRNGRLVARKTDCQSASCSYSFPVYIRDEHTFLHARVRQSEKEYAWVSPVWVHGLCKRPEDCPTTRLVPGGQDPKTNCFATWRVLPGPDRDETGKPTHRATCIDGDRNCDFGFTEGSCAMRVSACVGIESAGGASCHLGPIDSFRLRSYGIDANNYFDHFQERQLRSAFHALGPTPAPGTCTPYIDIRVPVRDERRTNRPAERQLITRLESGGSVDRDSLTLVCVGKGKGY